MRGKRKNKTDHEADCVKRLEQLGFAEAAVAFKSDAAARASQRSNRAKAQGKAHGKAQGKISAGTTKSQKAKKQTALGRVETASEMPGEMYPASWGPSVPI